MLHVPVPGGDDLWLEHLVLDVNGTLTNRGRLVKGVEERLGMLRRDLAVHLLSADTYGNAEEVAAELGAEFRRISCGEDKRAYVESLKAQTTAAVGNGRNDVAMLAAAAVGIAVLGPEAASSRALAAADIVASSMPCALDLLMEPTVLTATLRP